MQYSAHDQPKATPPVFKQPRWLHYAKLYREFVSNCFAEALSYRLHFVLMIIMDLIFYLSVLGAVDFLFIHLERIGSWGRTEFMFFMGFMIAVEHLHMTFISENFWMFSSDIRLGKLDFILLKPVNGIFVCFFRFMRPATLLNGIVPWGLLGYYGSQLNLGLWQWFLLPPLVVMGLALLTSVEIVLSMSMFWIVESMGVNFLRMQLQKVARWPDFVYHNFARKLFSYAIPVLLVGTAPVQFLLDPGEWFLLVKVGFILVICWGLTAWLWRKGLNAYESASS